MVRNSGSGYLATRVGFFVIGDFFAMLQDASA